MIGVTARVFSGSSRWTAGVRHGGPTHSLNGWSDLNPGTWRDMPGTIVTTPRSDVHYLVTEYGVADLRLKSVPERVREILAVAHPDFRDELRHKAEEAGLLF